MQSVTSVMSAALERRSPLRTLTRCLVCGSSEVRSDEVVDLGVVFLHECPHCEHRWTSSAPVSGPQPLAARPSVREEPLAA